MHQPLLSMNSQPSSAWIHSLTQNLNIDFLLIQPRMDTSIYTTYIICAMIMYTKVIVLLAYQQCHHHGRWFSTLSIWLMWISVTGAWANPLDKPPIRCILSKLILIHRQRAHLLLIRMVLLFFQSDFPVQSYEHLNASNTQVDFDRTRYL